MNAEFGKTAILINNIIDKGLVDICDSLSIFQTKRNLTEQEILDHLNRLGWPDIADYWADGME